MINFGTLFWPIAMTHSVAIFCKSGEHHHDYRTLFPNHLPEIGSCMRQGSLSCYICRVPWIVVRLQKKNQNNFTFTKICCNSVSICKQICTYLKTYYRFAYWPYRFTPICSITLKNVKIQNFFLLLAILVIFFFTFTEKQNLHKRY